MNRRNRKVALWLSRCFWSTLPVLCPLEMDPRFYTQFNSAQPTAPSGNQSLAQLLHRADTLSRAFSNHHASSFNNVQSVQSACNQLQNLLAMPSTPVTRARPEGGMKERGMVKASPAAGALQR